MVPLISINYSLLNILKKNFKVSRYLSIIYIYRVHFFQDSIFAFFNKVSVTFDFDWIHSCPWESPAICQHLHFTDTFVFHSKRSFSLNSHAILPLIFCSLIDVLFYMTLRHLSWNEVSSKNKLRTHTLHITDFQNIIQQHKTLLGCVYVFYI